MSTANDQNDTPSAPVYCDAKKVTRVGVYGIAINDGKMLLIKQPRGPYAGMFDFPGGGVEFGESVEEALRREFAEEVAMSFSTFVHADNLTATFAVPKSSFGDPYHYYQIGLIYLVFDLQPLAEGTTAELQPFWVDPSSLTQGQCSPLLWKYVTAAKQHLMDRVDR